MDLVKIFRLTVVINFIFAISHLILDYDSFIISSTSLSNLVEESHVSVVDKWNTFALIAYSLALLSTYPLLFFFVKWSRELLIVLLSLIILITVMDGSNGSYIVSSEFEVLALILEALTHGAILAIAYLTPVKDKFN